MAVRETSALIRFPVERARCAPKKVGGGAQQQTSGQIIRTGLHIPLEGLGDVPKIIEGMLLEAGCGTFTATTLLPMQRYFTEMLGVHVTPQKVHEQLQIVRGYSDDDLRGIAGNSVKTDWRRKPAYYRALLDEIITRGLFV